jgi:hypothetical protein
MLFTVTIARNMIRSLTIYQKAFHKIRTKDYYNDIM